MSHTLRTRLLTAATGGTLIAVGYFPPDSLGPGLSTGEVLDKIVPALMTCILGVLFIAHALADGGTALLFSRSARKPQFEQLKRDVSFLLERGQAQQALTKCRIHLQRARTDAKAFELALRVAGEQLASPREVRRLLADCRRAKLDAMDARRLRMQAQSLLKELQS